MEITGSSTDKKLSILLIVFFSMTMSLSQNSSQRSKEKPPLFEKIDTNKIKFVLGFETAGAGATIVDTINSGNMRVSLITWEPYGLFYPFKKVGLGFGFYGKIEHFQSNFLPDEPTLFEIGPHVRYFLPFDSKRRFLRRLRLSIALSVSLANYYYEKSPAVLNPPPGSPPSISIVNTVYLDGEFDQTVLKIPLIASYRIIKNFNVSLKVRYLNFIGRQTLLQPSLGFEYFFHQKQR